MALGKQIKFYRDKLNLTLEQLEEMTGVGTGTISALEVRDSVRSKYAPALAAAFGLSVEQLLDESRDWFGVAAQHPQPAVGGRKVAAISDLAAADLWVDYQRASRAARLVADLAIGRNTTQDIALRQSVQAALAVAAASFPDGRPKPTNRRTGSSIP